MQTSQSISSRTIKNCPIIVYQMGKVGSETILNSLEKITDLSHPLYHIHVLASPNIKKSLEQIRSQGGLPTLQLQHSQIIRAYLDENTSPELKVITGVREPISQLISAFFQNIKQNHPSLIQTDGTFDREGIEKHLMGVIENYDPKTAWNCNWFDNDFQSAININIYEKGFPHEKGYDIFSKNNISVLVLRLESSDIWEDAITEFLNLEEKFKIYRQNISDSKEYNTVYREVVSKLKFTTKTLNNIYSSKYCRHFYSQHMIQSFIEKWSL
jgi:hypothetical protein